MGEQHIKQEEGINNCGAYCIAYLMSAYLDSLGQTKLDDNARTGLEVAILDDSWEKINYGNKQASNPFKMQKYLLDGEYNKILSGISFRLNGLNVFIRIRLNDDDITKHPLYLLLDPMQSDAGLGGKTDILLLKTDIDSSFEYMIGVFLAVADVNAEVKETDPGKYHYILLHRIDDIKWEYIDPHNGQWESLDSTFNLNAPYSFPVKNTTGLYWKWMDFGLLIQKN